MSNIRSDVAAFHENYPNKLKWIAGKWFDYQDIEISNIERYIFEMANSKEYAKDFLFFRKSSDLKDFLNMYIFAYGEPFDWWPELPIVKQARLLVENGHTIDKNQLAFPITIQQALIMAVLLFHPEEEVFFIVTGIGGSGKSTYGNIIKQLFENDVCFSPIENLNGFKLEQAVRKRLIYSEEIGHGDLNCSAIKVLASKQCYQVEGKFKDPINVQTQSSLLFNCNRAPKIDIDDSGIMRRLIFYCRDEKILNPDKSLNKKIYTQQELLNFAIYSYLIYEEYNKDGKSWRDIFEYDTFNTIMKDNRVYKYFKKWNIKEYSDYREKCAEDKIPDRYILAERNYYSIIDYIEEGIKIQEKDLPF